MGMENSDLILADQKTIRLVTEIAIGAIRIGTEKPHRTGQMVPAIAARDLDLENWNGWR